MRLLCDPCEIRSWRVDDAAALVRHADDRRVWANLRDAFPHPYTRADAAAWLRSAPAETPETNFAIALAGEAVGGIGLRLQDDVFRRGAEVGYWLGAAHWGRGFATAAVRVFSDWAFAEHELVRLFAGVFAWNQASARVLEKAGYVCEGRLRRSVVKDGRIGDQLLYARTLA